MENFKKIFRNFIIITMVICFVIGSIGTYHVVHALENEWETEDFELPVALRGASVQHVDGKMYVIGGDKGMYSPANTVHIYDFRTKTWSTGSSMSQPRSFIDSIVVNEKIYIMGGQKVANGKDYSVTDVEIYDIATDTWTKGNPMPLPTVHSRTVLYNNKMYVFAGCQVTNGQINTSHKAIQIYDMINDTWIVDNSLPFARYGFTLNLIEDKVYLMGGYSGGHCNDVKIYDFITETWSDGQNMKIAKCYASSVLYDNKIYLYGGNSTSTIYNNADVYNPVTNTWSEANNLTIAKRHSKSIITNGIVYLVGGETNLSATTSKTIESLLLPPSYNRLFAHLYINEKTQLSFSHTIADNQMLTWKSSSPRVASVDSNGFVTTLEKGTTFISAYNQNGTFLDYIPIIVTDDNTYRIAVHLNIGQKLKLYLNGNPSSITWISMDQNIATVDNNGLVNGVGKGLAIVKALLNGEEHYIYIRVQ